MKKITVKLFVFAASFAFGMFIAKMAKGTDNDIKGVLWKIEGEGIKTSYLFGTFHLLGKSDFRMTENITDLVKDADKLALELDMDDPTMQTTMMKYAAMKGDQSLKDLLSKKEYQSVDAKLTEVMGVGLEAFNKMKPFMISSMLYPTLIGEETASYEMALIEIALGAQKEVIGLETVEEQLSIFDRIPYEQQADVLLEMVNDEERLSKEFKNMVEHYHNGDIEVLYKTVGDYYEDPKHREWLLDDRNEKWVANIPVLSSENSIFYAVGAGHLGGEKGLIKLLRKNGYNVTAVDK